jgi:hypothetical protein
MKLKHVHKLASVHKDAALVSIGWLSFLLGMLIPDPIVKTILMAIARVLPKALYQSFIGANFKCSSCISPVFTWR